MAQTDGQAGYRRLGGSVSAGWLDTATTNLLAGSTRNPFASISFDYRDAVVDPAFINYRIQPTFGSGFQDLFGTSSPRTGVAAEANFLPARPFPLRIYYSKFRRETLVASSQYYGRVLAQSDDSLAGLQWRLHVPRWPKLEFSVSDSNAETRPEEVLTVGHATHTRHLAVTGNDARWGWIFDGGVQLQRQDATRLGASDSGALPFESTSDIRTVRALARRDFGRRFSVVLNANGSTTDSSVSSGFLRQRYATYSARLLFQPSTRLSSWVEGRLLGSNLEARSADIAGGPGFVVPRTRSSSRIADWETRYTPFRGFSVLARLEFTGAAWSTAGQPEQAADFLNTVGGVQLQRQFGWVDLGASYTLNRYRRNADDQSDSDQLGQSVDGNVSVGKASAIRITVGYSLSRSRQEVRTTLPYTSDSQRVRVALEKHFSRGVRLEARWDLTDSIWDSRDLRSDFSGQGYGGTASVKRLTATFDRGYGSGDSIQQGIDSRFMPDPGAPPLFIVGSANEYTAASVTCAVNSTLSVRAAWRDQRQEIGVLKAARIEHREAVLSYTFRLLKIEGGYVSNRYDFGSPVFRKSLMFRVVRNFQWF